MVNFDELKLSKDKSLRNYQRDNKEKIYESWKSHKSVMLQMPTGTGKTRLFASIIKDVLDYSKSRNLNLTCLVIVHRMELIDQIVKTLLNTYGLSSGIIQAGFRQNASLPLQVASVQTLSRRLDKWTDKLFDFIIVDEAHHVPANSYIKIINAFPCAKLLGVTATPYRLSGEGFSDIFDELIISPSIRDFINMGVLSRYDYYSVKTNSLIQRKINGLKGVQAGDYTDAEMTKLCDNNHIRAQVVETYLKYARGKKGIVYTINKKHNYHLCRDFEKEGIRTVAIDSSTPLEERNKYIQDFKAGNIDVICNVNIFSEGFDCPDIEFIQLARPTQSLSMYLQQVGRGLRISNGKNKCIFLDNVGLYNRFGLPSSKREWYTYFLGLEIESKKSKNGIKHYHKNQERDLSEGNEKVFLIETPSELEDEKRLANDIFTKINELNNILIERDNYALRKLEAEFSNTHKCSLCFDGKLVSVWNDNGKDKNVWDVPFYLKNFKFRFENELETRYLKDEVELNKWLTFRFLSIRSKYNSSVVSHLRDEIDKYSIDKDYLMYLYNRWLDNPSIEPYGRNQILEQLITQMYDYIFCNDSGNRVFALIMQMLPSKRKIAIGRDLPPVQ